MKVKEKSEKAGLKLNIQKTKMMASSPIIHGKQMGKSGNSDKFYLLELQNHCSHKIKTLAPWKKSYDNPRPHIKQKRYHLTDQGLYSQSYGFPNMYGCESWTIKKAEH